MPSPSVLVEEVGVDSAELEQKMEDAELRGQQQELPTHGPEIDNTIVPEVSHDIDNRGGDDGDDEGFDQEEPGVRGGKGGVFDHDADIAEEDDGAHDGCEEETCEKLGGVVAGDGELEGDLGGKCQAAEQE